MLPVKNSDFLDHIKTKFDGIDKTKLQRVGNTKFMIPKITSNNFLPRNKLPEKSMTEFFLEKLQEKRLKRANQAQNDQNRKEQGSGDHIVPKQIVQNKFRPITATEFHMFKEFAIIPGLKPVPTKSSPSGTVTGDFGDKVREYLRRKNLEELHETNLQAAREMAATKHDSDEVNQNGEQSIENQIIVNEMVVKKMRNERIEKFKKHVLNVGKKYNVEKNLHETNHKYDKKQLTKNVPEENLLNSEKFQKLKITDNAIEDEKKNAIQYLRNSFTFPF